MKKLIFNSILNLIYITLKSDFKVGEKMDIVIIGGGASGLVASIYLSKKYNVTILEKKGFKPFLHLIIIADICFVILTALERFDLVPVVLTFGTIGAFSLVLWKGRQPYIANVATTVLGFIYEKEDY